MGRYFAAGGVAVLFLTFLFAYLSGYPDARLLPLYAGLSLVRISAVFVLSLAVGVGLGILAATSRSAGRVMIPIFDVLQSVPVLGYFPVLLVGVILAVPGVVGEELGVAILLFTAMEWSIFFGVVGAVKAIPQTVEEAASGFGLNGYHYFRNVVLPAILPALLSASTLAWSDGWTFDAVSEFVNYGNRLYTVPGLGSFIEKASQTPATLGVSWLGLLVMGELVVITNQLVWHRLADQAAKHRAHLGFHVPERVVHPLRSVGGQSRRMMGLRYRVELLHRARAKYGFSTKRIAEVFGGGLLVVGLALVLSDLIPDLPFIGAALSGQSLATLLLGTASTLLRMTAVYLACLLISVGVALLVAQGRLSASKFYVAYDIGRAVPYLALFPPMFATLVQVLPGALGLEVSSYLILFMGMIWYVIFNVVSAASFLPTELKEVSALFGFKGSKLARSVIVPALLPAIITGSILAWGGGWNVVIYSEYARYGGTAYSILGLGSLLDEAAAAGNPVLVGVYLFVMSGIVILLGRLVWRRLLSRVEKRGLDLS
ncbi:MAG: ABC transporter permease subunit [archaeon]|nr:MAG: ABC transporter permease subunit [archaeon]